MKTLKNSKPEEVTEILKAMRIKSKDLVDGQKYFYYQEIRGMFGLRLGDACRCDGEGCQNVGAINSGSVLADNPIEILKNHPFVQSKFLVGDDMGCYDADGSGDVLCGACSNKRDAAMKLNPDDGLLTNLEKITEGSAK